MPKPLVRRICIGALLTAIIVAAAYGVYQTVYWFWARKTVEYALSGRAGCNLAQHKLVRLGERAVPIVFSEMRAHPEETSSQLCFGGMVLSTLALEQKLDPTIPYLGRVLRDTREERTIRESAACIIRDMWYSDQARDALEDRALHDPSVDMRALCLGFLGGHADTRAAYLGRHPDLHPRIIRLLEKASKDPDPRIRRGAYGAAGQLAQWACQHNTKLMWADTILTRAAKDPDPRVQEDYAAMMHVIREIKKSRP